MTPRPPHYITADDALRYAHRFNPVYATHGWARVLIDENLPGWTLRDVMRLLQAQRILVRRKGDGWVWRRPEVVGVVLEGDTVMHDVGDLEHPAKSAHRRFIDIGATNVRYVRHLRGDHSTVVVHVRTAAETTEDRLLHEMMRETYLASSVRPDLVLNVSGSLVDPLDPPFANEMHGGPRLHLDIEELATTYQKELADLLVLRRAQHGAVALVTLNTHDGGRPIKIGYATTSMLPPALRKNASNITSRVLSVRVDMLAEANRADTVARLLRLLERAKTAV